MGKKNKSKGDKPVVITKEKAVQVVSDFASAGNAVILIEKEGKTINAGLPMDADERQKLLFQLATKHLKFLSYAPIGALKAMLAQTESALEEMENGSCRDPDCPDCGSGKHSNSSDDEDDDYDDVDIIFEPELKLDTTIKKIGRKKIQ